MRIQRYTVKEKYKKQSQIAEEVFKDGTMEIHSDLYWLMDTQETDNEDLMQAAALLNIQPAQQQETKIFVPDILFVSGSSNEQNGYYVIWRNKPKPITFRRTFTARPRTNEISQLAKMRCQQGLTQKALAEISGVKLSTIQEYESALRRSINKATVEDAFKIAKALGCAIEDLMETEAR